MNKEQPEIISLLEFFGYTVEFDDSGLDGNLIPAREHLPKGEIHLPDDENVVTDLRMDIMTFDDEIDKEALLFISEFNWECAFGKLIYNRDEKRLCFQRLYELDPYEIDPDDFKIDLEEANCYAICVSRVLELLVSRELASATEAIEALESLLERVVHAEGCDCGDEDCDCGDDCGCGCNEVDN